MKYYCDSSLHERSTISQAGPSEKGITALDRTGQMQSDFSLMIHKLPEPEAKLLQIRKVFGDISQV